MHTHALIFGLAACAPDSSLGPDETGIGPVDTARVDTAVDPTTSSEPETTPPDCEHLPGGGVPVTTLDTIQTTEDFDFDARGMLVFAANTVVLASDGTPGEERKEIVTGGGSWEDAHGIQTLSTGDLAIAMVTMGSVRRVEREEGGIETILGSLNSPNALEVGTDDLLYFTDGQEVATLDPLTGERTHVAGGFDYANGLALNEAQDRLYIADNVVGIFEVRRSAQGGWEAPVMLLSGRDQDAIEVDRCGNLYTVGFWSGSVQRIDVETGERATLANLPNGGVFSAVRWGSDRGIWRRDVLYVTDRSHIYAVEVGVEGRPQPVDLAPDAVR